MKKLLQSGILTASLALSSVYSQQASAIAGAALTPVSAPLIASGVCFIVFSEAIGAVAGVAGAAAGGAGGGIMGGVLGTTVARPVEGAFIGAATGAYSLGVGGAVVGTIWGVYHGIVMLEDDKNGDFKFSTLDKEFGEEKLELSSEQIEIFNENIDSLNLIKEQVASTLSMIKDPQYEDAARAWENVKPDIEELGVELDTIAKVVLPVLR